MLKFFYFFFFSFVILFFSFFSFSPVLAVAPTPTPTLTPDVSLGFDPSFIFPTFDISCPESIWGWGTLTPSADWLAACSHCVPTLTPIPTSTYLPTFTPTPCPPGGFCPTPTSTPSSPTPTPFSTPSGRIFYNPSDIVDYGSYVSSPSEDFHCSVSSDGSNMHCSGSAFWTETSNIVDGGVSFHPGFSSNEIGPYYWNVNEWVCPFTHNPISDDPSLLHNSRPYEVADAHAELWLGCSNTDSSNYSQYPADTSLSAY